MKTEQECLFELREAAGGEYVAISRTVNLFSGSTEPVVKWAAWRCDLKKNYYADTYEEAFRRAINDIR